MDQAASGPWQCLNFWMNYGCVAGYICNEADGTCEMTEPGEVRARFSAAALEVVPRGRAQTSGSPTAADPCPPLGRLAPRQPQGDTKENCEASCTARTDDTPSQYTCDVTTFTCVESDSGTGQGSCDSACADETPSQIVGLWRGLSVNTGFDKVTCAERCAANARAAPQLHLAKGFLFSGAIPLLLLYHPGRRSTCSTLRSRR